MPNSAAARKIIGITSSVLSTPSRMKSMYKKAESEHLWKELIGTRKAEDAATEKYKKIRTGIAHATAYNNAYRFLHK